MRALTTSTPARRAENVRNGILRGAWRYSRLRSREAVAAATSALAIANPEIRAGDRSLVAVAL